MKNEDPVRESSLGHAPEALTLRDVWFRYERESDDVLRGLSLSLWEGEVLSIVGGNGAGKSTALRLAAGAISPLCGSVVVKGQKLKRGKNNWLYEGTLALLPQDVTTMFTQDTVEQELAGGTSPLLARLLPLKERHPYDLSGGEQQLLGIHKLLLRAPAILLLDEPTKGLDALACEMLTETLREYAAGGAAVLLVTHDTDFAASVSDRCALFFDGQAASPAPPREFFSRQYFYTTGMNRITRGIWPDVMTFSQAEKMVRERT